jgi:hypothetical protein
MSVRELLLSAIPILAMACASPATAAPKRIFDCRLGAKRASVTFDRGRYVYRYGTGTRAELTLAGNASTRNVFFYSNRYASIEYQLRFTKGGVSYILYSMEANRTTGSNAVSGLLVLRGGVALSDRSCSPWSRLSYHLTDRKLPLDPEAFSAISGTWSPKTR